MLYLMWLACPDFITDDGATYRDALKALQKFGFLNEEEYDYTDEHLNDPPEVEDYKKAFENTCFIKSYRK